MIAVTGGTSTDQADAAQPGLETLSEALSV